ncbi:P-loop containing nucleoside triphosphate hydrolase protein [Obelidium mucronatum]|nr:P-loop containing nucleoside triphosphate hydrolase protein [Obelidium mucronatum]
MLIAFRNYFSAVLFIMCYGPVSQLLLFGAITEKQERLKESLWMMGVTFAEYTTSWFLTALLESLPVWVLVAILTKVMVLPGTSAASLIGLTILTGLSTISLTFVFDVFFANARTGPSLGLLLLIAVTSVVCAVMSAVDLQSGALWILSILFTPGAWWIGMSIIIQAEVPVGALPDKTGGVTLLAVFLMLLGQCIVYLGIAWYLSHVVPQPFGSPRSPWFLFDSGYWNPKTQTAPSGFVGSSSVSGNALIEELQGSGNIGISIKNLSKVFVNPQTKTKHVAVKNLSLDVKTGTVLGLLGRNGAGKTTLISMLTGILPPTSGDATVGGSSIFSSRAHTRGSLGVCPQQDTIFPTLTVRETLILYAQIKNVPFRRISAEVDEIMKDIGLAEKANYLSGSLSGGQKRRLSVGIAFIGGSQIVILDEMTSGVDPLSRRELWKIVEKYKSKCTILLTTHFLDEAEALSDRIAILGEGELKCVGSSLFLKKEYGVGYSLVIVVPGIAASYVDHVKGLVLRFAPDAEVVSVAGGEIQFRLSPTHSSQFGNMIRQLESSSDIIQSFNLTVTTLDEVFLRLSMGANQSVRGQPKISPTRGPSPAISWLSEHSQAPFTKPSSAYRVVAVRPSFVAQTLALVKKVVLTTLRERVLFSTRILFPILSSVICAVLLRNDAVYGCNYVQPAPATSSLSHFKNSPLFVFPASYTSDLSQLLNGTVPVVGLPSADAVDSIVTNKSSFAIPPILDLSSEATSQVSVPSVGDSQDIACAVSNLATNLVLQKRNPGAFVNLTTHRLIGVPQVDWNFAPINNVIWLLQFFGYAMPGLLASNNLVRERTSNAKFQQYISGVRPLAYWTSQFIVDSAIVFSTSLVSALIFILAKTPNYSDSFIWLFLIIFGYGLSSTTIGYVASHWARFPSSLITMVLTFFGAVGFYMYLNTLAILLIAANLNIQSKAVQIFNLVLSGLNPCAALFHALFLYSNSLNLRCNADFSGVLSLLDTVWKPVVVLFGQTVVFFAIAILKDVKRATKSSTHPDGNEVAGVSGDEDVVAEDSAACSEKIVKDSGNLVLKRLNKQYGEMVAVKGLSFTVSKGTCFALLGSNGCGKTSTFNMLCGQSTPTSGEAFVNGWGLSENMTKIHESLGVCPQFDALQEYLTVREVITFYGQVKGIPSAELSAVVEELIARLDLTEHAGKLVGHLSGGNKRKTSVAIALIGDPPVILLDEPSTGMDILSKRKMWDVITGLLENHAVVITTHSMEEAEAISNRLAIMSRGQLKCIGSMSHLRAKFAAGLTIEMLLTDEHVDVRSFGLSIKELSFGQDLYVSIQTHEGQELSTLFDKCEDLKRQGLIQEYRISPSSLEQIFLDVINDAERDFKPLEDLKGLAGVEGWNNKYKRGTAVRINAFWVIFGFGWLAMLLTTFVSLLSIVTLIFSPASKYGFRYLRLLGTPFSKSTWDRIAELEKTVVEREDGKSIYAKICSIFAWIVFGFPIAVFHVFLAVLSTVTLVGAAFAPMHIRLAVYCLQRTSWK